MSFRPWVALLAACGMSLAFAADPSKQAQPPSKPTAPVQSSAQKATPTPASPSAQQQAQAAETTGQPQSAPTSQPQGSPKPQQTEVAEAMTAPAPAQVKPGDANAGQAKAAVCAACHGMDGNPAQSQYPKLAGQQEDYTARQLELFKEKKRDNVIMQGFAAPLQPQDMHDLGAFFATKTSLPGVADSGLVQRGEVLYRGGDNKLSVPACMACHGPDGRGNPGAGYPQLAGQYGDYIGAKLKDFRDQKSFGDDDRAKIMPLVAKGLSDTDIASLASYVEGLHAADADKSTAAK
jgi:cytochrome c553